MPARRPETRQRLQDRDRAIIAAFKAERVSYATLGQRFGVSESRVCQIVTREGARYSRADRLASRDRAMLRMAQQTPSPTLQTIGQQFGLCATSVARAIQRAERHAMRRVARQRTSKPTIAAMAGAYVSPSQARLEAGLPSPFPNNLTASREPCPMCGVRGDVGCRHRSAS